MFFKRLHRTTFKGLPAIIVLRSNNGVDYTMSVKDPLRLNEHDFAHPYSSWRDKALAAPGTCQNFVHFKQVLKDMGIPYPEGLFSDSYFDISYGKGTRTDGSGCATAQELRWMRKVLDLPR